MIQRFTTKRDENGNRKTLIVDHELRTFFLDYNTTYDYSDYITITTTDRRKMADALEEAGYFRTM